MKTDCNRLRLVMCVSALVLFLAATAHGQGPTFDPGCTVPYANIATTPDPFVACGNCGVVSANPHSTAAAKAAHAAESKAKNNLCGDATKKTVVDFAILAEMQAQTSNNIPSDRHTLRQFFTVGSQKIGEGSVVQLKALVREAHISDCDGGEAVNCNKTGPDVNDIHIPLADPTVANSRTLDECNSVTAEMIPHFRPAAWAQIDMKTPVNNPVRITGQLFYDNSHHPCVKNADGTFKKEKPARISLWEVHPVYQFDVCTETDANQCDIANDSVWVPYDQWVARAGSITEDAGKDFRSRCERLKGTPSQPGGPTEPGQCPAPASAPHGHRHRAPAPPST
jgi:hypothetical protein